MKKTCKFGKFKLTCVLYFIKPRDNVLNSVPRKTRKSKKKYIRLFLYHVWISLCTLPYMCYLCCKIIATYILTLFQNYRGFRSSRIKSTLLELPSSQNELFQSYSLKTNINYKLNYFHQRVIISKQCYFHINQNIKIEYFSMSSE